MKIAVYCSAKDTIPAEYLALGEMLGTWIGNQGDTLVYGGATGGLMSRTSEAVHAAGGHVIGVIPPCIIAAGRLASNCNELINVANMSERKQQMRDLADVIVCLPGSYGTLDEMLDATSSAIVGEHNKLLFVVNYNGFYEPLKQQLEHMRELSFIPNEECYKPIFVDSLDELYNCINNLKRIKI